MARQGLLENQGFAINFDADKMLVQHGSDGLVLERFPLHHVTPVTGEIADREQDGTVLCFCRLQGLRSLGVSVDRVRGMLEEIGTDLVEKPIRKEACDLMIAGLFRIVQVQLV